MTDRTEAEGWSRFSAEEITGISVKAYGCYLVVEKARTGEEVEQEVPEPSAEVAVTAHASLPAGRSGCWEGIRSCW